MKTTIRTWGALGFLLAVTAACNEDDPAREKVAAAGTAGSAAGARGGSDGRGDGPGEAGVPTDDGDVGSGGTGAKQGPEASGAAGALSAGEAGTGAGAGSTDVSNQGGGSSAGNGGNAERGGATNLEGGASTGGNPNAAGRAGQGAVEQDTAGQGGSGAGDPAGAGGAGGGGPDGKGGVTAGGHSSAEGGNGGANDGAAGAPSGAGGAEGGQGGATPCDPTLGPAEDACVITEDLGIFVSAAGSDTEGDGSRATPLATISQAVTLARTTGQRVYACATAGAYEERLDFDDSHDGVEVYGGFDCAGGAWSYEILLQAQVRSPEPVAATIQGTRSLTLENLSLTAEDATEPSESSIALLAANAEGVTLRRVTLTAGDGAAGANGEDGQPGADGAVPGPAQKGAPGVCQEDLEEGDVLPDELPGGAWDGPSACGSKGGDGGTGVLGEGAAASGAQGEPVTEEDRGRGGAGQEDELAGPVPGEKGARGIDGTQPQSAAEIGSFSVTGYLPADGYDGADGTAGQGGGGGGASRGTAACVGSSGGAGGQGGCGGTKGTAGKGGGASVALVSWESELVLSDVTLVANNGGSGGDGGAGGLGGTFGPGAAGSTNASVLLLEGASGGHGGSGGNASGGSGGSGGPSLALAYRGSPPTRGGPTSSSLGEGGLGGLGGATTPGGRSFDGWAGTVAEAYEITDE